MEGTPEVFVFAGPNGAGKTTVAEILLPSLGVAEFVNSDIIAENLGLPHTRAAAFHGGRIARQRIESLRKARQDFAFETTLAGQGMEKRLLKLAAAGYEMHVLYLALPSAEHAVRRVEQRVKRGGHPVPPDDVRRRFEPSRANFLQLRHLFASWRVYDTRGYSRGAEIPLIAAGRGVDVAEVRDEAAWAHFNSGQRPNRRMNRGQ